MQDGSLIARFGRARHDGSLAVLEGLHALKHALRFGARVRRAVAPDPARVVALARELAPDVADEIAALVEHGDVRAPLDVVEVRGGGEELRAQALRPAPVGQHVLRWLGGEAGDEARLGRHGLAA